MTQRRSQRVSRPPTRLNAAYLRAPQGRAPLHGPATYATFPFPDQPVAPNFPPVIPDLGPDPMTYREAITSPDCDMWQTAIHQEYDALMARKTWELVPLPAGRKTIRCKWVFKKKMNADGTVSRYKARLCMKGFTQHYGLDYMDTFSPTVGFSTLRLLFQLAVQYRFDIQQIDVDSAFLYADLQE